MKIAMIKFADKIKNALHMPWTDCAAAISASMQEECGQPLVGGYTGRAVMIQWSIVPTFTEDATNKRMITAIDLGEGKAIALNNLQLLSPFTGSNKAGNTDDGRRKILKTFSFSALIRGAALTSNVLEGMYFGNGDGQGFVIVAEKVDRCGDGSYEVIGYEDPFMLNDDGVTQDEYANGGAYVLTGSCKETAFEYTFFDTDLATTKTAFEALLANTY